MNQILRIEEDTVLIGTDENSSVKIPRSCLEFDDPKVGDLVRAFKTGDTVIIRREEPEPAVPAVVQESAPVQYAQMPQAQQQQQQEDPQPDQEPQSHQEDEMPYYPPYQRDYDEKSCNKHVFVWICNFLLGGFGVDRFVRGQIILGILKLVTGGGFGIWSMVDFIISLIKAYGTAFANEEDVFFLDGKYSA